MGIAAYEFPVVAGILRLTACITISTFPGAKLELVGDRIARAGATIYRAKENGRNQVRS